MQRDYPTAGDLVAVPTNLAVLPQRQSGVVTRGQLRALGIRAGQVQAAIDARRWRPLGVNVLVLHNGSLARRQREWVAVLLPNKPTALAGLSAATAAGLSGFEPGEVHIVVSHDTRTRLPMWVRVHESRRFSPDDIRSGAGPPRTSIARSTIDAAAWSASARRACAILCASVQQRLVTADQLERDLRRAGSVRHVALMRDILGDIGGGGHTLAEIDLGRLAMRAGLGPPRRQAQRAAPNGRIRYVDAEFDLPDGTALVVEVDGALHLKPLTWWDDMHRQNELVIGGLPVMRYLSVTIRLDERRVVDQLRRVRLAHAAA